jgi:NADPH:quinone reductase-like Zn-dependent oxidoreductase
MPHAGVLTRYGPPKALAWSLVAMPGRGPARIGICAHAGVSPSDPGIRRGELRQGFRWAPSAVLGFEAAGTLDAIGPAATDYANRGA